MNIVVVVSHLIMSNSLWTHGIQHARLPCSWQSCKVCSNSCPLTCWCHSTISSSDVPFSSCPQFFPTLGSFPMSQLFASGGQCIGVSASALVLPMNIQHWLPLGLTGLILLINLWAKIAIWANWIQQYIKESYTRIKWNLPHEWNFFNIFKSIMGYDTLVD